jgi:hypothetical protein
VFRKKRESNVVADVSFLHAIPPNLIRFRIKALSNTQAEIITLCHRVVQIHVIVVTIDDLSVEVIVSHLAFPLITLVV